MPERPALPCAESESVDTVSKCRADEVKVGDTIWVQDDGDWFRVAEIHEGQWGLAFYRNNRSLAEFPEDATILRREGEISISRSKP